MEAPLGFIDDHVGSSSDKDGDSLVYLAVFNDSHFLILSTEANFSDDSSSAEFLGFNFRESGDDSSSESTVCWMDKSMAKSASLCAASAKLSSLSIGSGALSLAMDWQ